MSASGALPQGIGKHPAPGVTGKTRCLFLPVSFARSVSNSKSSRRMRKGKSLRRLAFTNAEYSLSEIASSRSDGPAFGICSQVVMTWASTAGIRFCWKKSSQKKIFDRHAPSRADRVRMVAAISSASLRAAVFVQNRCPSGLVI